MIWAIGGIVAILIIGNPISQILLFLVILLFSKICSLKLKEIFHSIRYLLLFLPITFIIHLLFNNSAVDSEVRGFTAHGLFTSLSQPVKFTFRLLNFLVFMSFLARWISSLGFLDSIRYVLKPLRKLRIPVDDIFQIIFIAVRFFPIVREEFWRLDETWRTFIGVSKTGFKDRVLRIRSTLIPLMIFSFQRAEIMADAMKIRGYSANSIRSHYTRMDFGYDDLLFALSGASISIILIAFL